MWQQQQKKEIKAGTSKQDVERREPTEHQSRAKVTTKYKKKKFLNH